MKTRKQLRKMSADAVVDYLLNNHQWHRLKFYDDRSGHYMFKIAGFKLTQHHTISAYGGRYGDNYCSYTSYTLVDTKTGKGLSITKSQGERLYDTFCGCYGAHKTMRHILWTLLVLGCGTGAGTIIHHQKQVHKADTSVATKAQIEPHDAVPFYYQNNEHQH